MSKNKKTVIIGLDGVPFELLKDLAEREIMGNVKKLISKGTLKKMSSSIPEVSCVAWSSIITGANPAEHGIFGFMDFSPNTYRLIFPNFDNLAYPPFWHDDHINKYVILNIPSTYPARRLNGTLISGFVALQFDKAVYPESIIPDLKKMDYRIDVDSDKAHKSMELFLRDLDKTNEARISAYRYLWKKDWNVFMLVFTGTDRLMHFLWDAYEDEHHDFHKGFMNYFKKIDGIIGEIADALGDEDNFIMLSDHGFERLDNDVYINTILKNNGFLNLENGKPASFSTIDVGTKAFALDPARIYVHMKGKYPRGSVDPTDRRRTVEDLADLFKNFEINGQKVIKRICRREEIYSGPHIDRAPDLVLIGNKGFNLKSAVTSDCIYSKSVFTGKHTQDNAFLAARDCDIKHIIPEKPTVFDIAGIVKRGL